METHTNPTIPPEPEDELTPNDYRKVKKHFLPPRHASYHNKQIPAGRPSVEEQAKRFREGCALLEAAGVEPYRGYTAESLMERS